MSKKTLNVRMIQKHDSAENWDNELNFYPAAGEILIYDNNKIKIGDGKNLPKDLPFLFSPNIANDATIGTEIQPVYISKGAITPCINMESNVSAEDISYVAPVSNNESIINTDSTQLINVSNNNTLIKLLAIDDKGYIHYIDKTQLINEIINQLSLQNYK